MKARNAIVRKLAAVFCAMLMAPGDTLFCAVGTTQNAAAVEQQSAKIPNEQLDSLVAPIALYPDPLLAQTLVASTYPLEVIQLHQWLGQNKGLKDKALTEAVEKQGWDASIQAMAAFPDLVKQLAENIRWTADLGNAFLAQQSDVMDAVQRMRAKAKDHGNLKTTEQQKIETKVIENKSVVVIEPASPEIVYVPSYNPTVVYGAPAYPYPAISYPPPGYYAAGMALSFGVGVAMGAAWGGGWGWNSGWGGNNNVYVNHNNNFINNSNRQNYNRQNVNHPSQQPSRGGNTWQHDPQHRGGAPYGNRETASMFGGTTRGDSVANRQASARQSIERTGGRVQSGSMDRSLGRTQPAAMDRGGSSGFGGGGDRVGNRSVSSPSSRGSSAFGGSGMSGSSARASSQRGSSSFGGSRGGGGGFSRGGGGRRR